jgi:hypothetical protein
MAQLGRKRGEAETELAVAREEHAAELKRVLDEAALLKGECNRDSQVEELAMAREEQTAELKRVMDEAELLKGELASARAHNESLVAEKMRHISEERSNIHSIKNLKAKLAATRTRVEVANHSYENLKAKIVSELEENILVLEHVEADATALWSSHTATISLLEEANCRNEHLEKENSAAREGLMREVEEANRSNQKLKAESVSEMERVKAELEEAIRSNENLKAKSILEMERIKAELEEAVILSELRLNHVLTLAFEKKSSQD